MDINAAFKSVSKVLIGQEIGELSEFGPYLSKYTEKLKLAKSVNEIDVYYTAPYCRNAKFVSFENAFEPSFREPIDLNEIKDVDSLLNAVAEKIHYSGNKVLGNSKIVQESENIVDSSVVYRSSEILRCEYIGYCSLLRDSKYMFGCTSLGESSFCIGCCEATHGSQRCFESNVLAQCSDVYYSNDCKNCREIMFCFDQHTQSHCIGNNKLEKEKYAELKKNLLQQIADELSQKKTIPSIADFALEASA